MTLLTVIEQTLYGGGNKQSLFPGIACCPYGLCCLDYSHCNLPVTRENNYLSGGILLEEVCRYKAPLILFISCGKLQADQLLMKKLVISPLELSRMLQLD